MLNEIIGLFRVMLQSDWLGDCDAVNAQLDQLADALKAVLRGDLSADDFRRQFPVGAVGPHLEPVLINVEHFLADADIRGRDVSYKEMQESRMAQLIAALRSGDVITAATVNFLL